MDVIIFKFARFTSVQVGRGAPRPVNVATIGSSMPDLGLATYELRPANTLEVLPYYWAIDVDAHSSKRRWTMLEKSMSFAERRR